MLRYPKLRWTSEFTMTTSGNQSTPTEALSGLADELHDVGAMHAPILEREKVEPQEGNVPLSLWFIAMIAAWALGNGYYLGRYSGGFKALVFDERAAGLPVVGSGKPPGEVDMAVLGKRTFSAMCMPCHQETGMGLPGQFPPLAGSEWVNASGHARLVRIVLDGFTGPVDVEGKAFNNTMVPWRDTLDDKQIAAVLTYVRQSWGNKGAPVDVDSVRTLRNKTKDHAGQSWTTELLKAIPEK